MIRPMLTKYVNTIDNYTIGIKKNNKKFNQNMPYINTIDNYTAGIKKTESIKMYEEFYMSNLKVFHGTLAKQIHF